MIIHLRKGKKCDVKLELKIREDQRQAVRSSYISTWLKLCFGDYFCLPCSYQSGGQGIISSTRATSTKYNLLAIYLDSFFVCQNIDTLKFKHQKLFHIYLKRKPSLELPRQFKRTVSLDILYQNLFTRTSSAKLLHLHCLIKLAMSCTHFIENIRFKHQRLVLG